MALPPERIVLKRRRDDEAVDCLYLQENRDKRFKADFHWARIGDNSSYPINRVFTGPSKRNGPEGIYEPAIDSHAVQVPDIGSTLPETEEKNRHEVINPPCLNRPKNSPQSRPRSLKAEALSEIQRPVSPQKARHFHLVKDSLLRPRQVSAGHGVQKNRSKARNDLALFTERRAVDALRLLDLDRTKESEATSKQKSEGATAHKSDLLQSETRIYKKPNATAEEVKWRAKTWSKEAQSQKIGNPNSGNSQRSQNYHVSFGDYSLELAMQLQEFAIGETYTSPNRTLSDKPRAQLKFRPKPPKSWSEEDPTPVEGTQKGEIVENATAEENAEEFVYDIFIRSEGVIPLDFSESTRASENHLDRAKSREVGLLVIEEGDKEAWEEYAEDVDGDKEWDTDDEDENAEDYYGNDYPEDELDSDDEFDRDAYKHRRYASDDDDEYDEDFDGPFGR